MMNPTRKKMTPPRKFCAARYIERYIAWYIAWYIDGCTIYNIY